MALHASLILFQVKSEYIDFEDSYSPPQRMAQPKIMPDEDKALKHAMLVSDIAEKMFEKTHLVYLEPERVFYYWNYRYEVWQPQGNSLTMCNS